MIEQVIFDLDGTLADSAALTLRAMQQVLPPLSVPVPGFEAIRRVVGIANPEFYHILFPALGAELVARVGQAVEAAELALLPVMGEELLFPGCRELLRALHRRNLPLYIASTGDTGHVHGLLNSLAIAEFFTGVSCHLPDKTGMLADITGGSGAGWLMVGDTRKDYEAARANGIPSVGALYGYCRREGTAFDYYIEEPAGLLPLLDAL